MGLHSFPTTCRWSVSFLQFLIVSWLISGTELKQRTWPWNMLRKMIEDAMRRVHRCRCPRIWGSVGCESFSTLWRLNVRRCVGAVVDLYGSWQALGGSQRLFADSWMFLGRFFDVCVCVSLLANTKIERQRRCQESLKTNKNEVWKEPLIFAASRGSATAQVYRHLSFVLQNATEHWAEKPSKSSSNRSPNGSESVKRNPWNDDGAETRIFGVGHTPRYPRPDLWAPFSIAKYQKNMNNAIKQLY